MKRVLIFTADDEANTTSLNGVLSFSRIELLGIAEYIYLWARVDVLKGWAEAERKVAEAAKPKRRSRKTGGKNERLRGLGRTESGG